MIRHGVTTGRRVGIIGIGGLGHIAIQLARALGATVTAISTSPNKRDEAFALGAHDFINMADGDLVRAGAESFDFLLSTISSDGVHWDDYLGLLRSGTGVLCMVGLPTAITFRPGGLVTRNLSIVGSYLASHDEITSMLEFVAKHDVKAQIETLPMTAANCNLALKRIADNAVRYRMVLINDHADARQ